MVLWLGFEPGRRLVGEYFHHTLVLATRCVELEDDGPFPPFLAVLSVFGAVSGFEVITIGVGSGDFHAGRNLAGAETVDKTVLDEDAGEVAVVAGDAEMVVEADIQWARR